MGVRSKDLATECGVVSVAGDPWTLSEWKAAREAEGGRQLTEKQLEAAAKLSTLGWRVIHVYSDRVLTMKRRELQVFISSDGKVTRPQTRASLLAQAEMHTAGVTIRG